MVDFLISLIYSENQSHRLFSKLVLIQSFVIIMICLYYISMTFPGSLNNKYKEKVMINC